jgi:hypothetical protein
VIFRWDGIDGRGVTPSEKLRPGVRRCLRTFTVVALICDLRSSRARGRGDLTEIVDHMIDATDRVDLEEYEVGVHEFRRRLNFDAMRVVRVSEEL